MGFSSAVATTLGAVAHARRGSAIHEVGTAYAGRLRPTSAPGADLFGPAERDVVVRVSRSLGLPPPLPDVFGLGLRLATPAGPQDVLLDSCGPGPLGRHAIAPRTDLRAGPLGSVVALRDGADGGTARPFHLAAFPRRTGPAVRDTADARGLTVVLAVAPPYGSWTALATVTCDDVAPDQTVRMSPVNRAMGIGLSPWWQQFRVRSYRASRAAAVRAGTR